MKTLKILIITIVVFFLGACGGSEPPAPENTTSGTQEKELNRAEPNPHTVRGMKKVMDDAKSVEDMLQQQHEEQRKEIDNIR